MTKSFTIKEEVTDCNVGDVLKTPNGKELMCTGKGSNWYKIGDGEYYEYELPEYFYTIKEVYPECGECGTYYKEK